MSAGTDGTILCLSYLASLPFCVRIEECQMSGFNTETLTVSCVSTLIFLQIYSLFLSTLFLLSTMVHDSVSVTRAGVQRLRVFMGVQPESKLRSSVLVPKSGQLSTLASSCSHCCLCLLPQQNLSHLPHGAVINHIFLLMCHFFASS